MVKSPKKNHVFLGAFTWNHPSSNRKGDTEHINKRNKDSQELEKIFKCKQCDFKTPINITLQKHINTKHVESSYSESISSFIYPLNLDKFASH